MYKYILFDFDGTVFDTVEGITKSARYALNTLGMDAELDELRCFAGPPLDDMFLERYGGTPEQAKQFVDTFRERYVPIGLYECRVFPQVKQLLQELRDDGRALAVATLKPQVLAETLLQREGMLDLFDAVCGSCAEGHEQTKSEIAQKAMALLGAAPEETVLIGDTKYDIHGAHECGIFAVGMEYGYAAPNELKLAGADLILPDIPALKKWLFE